MPPMKLGRSADVIAAAESLAPSDHLSPHGNKVIEQLVDLDILNRVIHVEVNVLARSDGSFIHVEVVDLVQINSAIVHSPDNSDIVPYRMYLQSRYINVLFSIPR
jgi:DhnA family fructose-bisphosphate aldolase class Ia